MKNPQRLIIGKYRIWALWSFRQCGLGVFVTKNVPCTDVIIEYEIFIYLLFYQVVISKLTPFNDK